MRQQAIDTRQPGPALFIDLNSDSSDDTDAYNNH